MPRKRDIKPGITTNEVLAELPPFTRLLFSWLPMWADREGRLEDRPKKLKAAIFPFDDVDMDKMLQELHDTDFILRYTIKGERLIQIVNFSKHQKPHPQESPSSIPAPDSKRRRLSPKLEALTTMVISEDDQGDEDLPPRTEPASLSPIPLSIPDNLAHGDSGKDTCRAAESPQSISPMRQVFTYWQEQTGHLKAVLSPERERKIRSRLKQFSVEDLCLAVDGCRGSPFHQGDNETGEVYDGIDLIFRDAAHVEKFKAIAEEGLNGAHRPGKQTGVDRYREGIEAVRSAYGTRREAGVDNHEGKGGV